MANRSDDQIEIGKRLKHLREVLGYAERGGQSEFATSMGFSSSQWNNWETGLKRPDVSNAIRICTRTGATLDWIYRGEWAGMPVDLASRLRGDHQRLRSA